MGCVDYLSGEPSVDVGIMSLTVLALKNPITSISSQLQTLHCKCFLKGFMAQRLRMQIRFLYLDCQMFVWQRIKCKMLGDSSKFHHNGTQSVRVWLFPENHWMLLKSKNSEERCTLGMFYISLESADFVCFCTLRFVMKEKPDKQWLESSCWRTMRNDKLKKNVLKEVVETKKWS